MTLYEELTDERGDKYRRNNLGGATWTQTPDRKVREFAPPLNEWLQSDTLLLETENGDNPPIVSLEKFAVFYLMTRVLFKAKAGDELFLYYGNQRVSAPSYDLNLVAGQLLAADKTVAMTAAEEQLKKSSWAESQTPGQGGVDALGNPRCGRRGAAGHHRAAAAKSIATIGTIAELLAGLYNRKKSANLRA